MFALLIQKMEIDGYLATLWTTDNGIFPEQLAQFRTWVVALPLEIHAHEGVER